MKKLILVIIGLFFATSVLAEEGPLITYVNKSPYTIILRTHLCTSNLDCKDEPIQGYIHSQEAFQFPASRKMTTGEIIFPYFITVMSPDGITIAGGYFKESKNSRCAIKIGEGESATVIFDVMKARWRESDPYFLATCTLGESTDHI